MKTDFTEEEDETETKSESLYANMNGGFTSNEKQIDNHVSVDTKENV